MITNRGVEIVATFRPNVDPAILKECKEVGADIIRVPMGKMDWEGVAELTEKAIQADLRVLWDVSGRVPRIAFCEAMQLVTDGREIGNYKFRPVVGDRLLVCSTGEQIPLEGQGYRTELTYLPQVLRIGDLVNFNEGQVRAVIESLQREEISSRLVATQMRVYETDRSRGPGDLFWKTKFGTEQRDRPFDSTGAAITEHDFTMLQNLKRVGVRPNKAAFSFINSGKELSEAKKTFNDLFQGPVEVNAKLENPQAVSKENLGCIIAQADRVTIARGDLGVHYPNIFEAQWGIIDDLQRFGPGHGGRVSFDIATHIAESMTQQALGGEKVRWLDQIEIDRFRREIRQAGLRAMWLTGDTIRIADQAPKLISELVRCAENSGN